MKHITVGYIAVNAAKGTIKDSAMQEAIILALTENREVLLTFNDSTTRIKPSEVLQVVALKGAMA